MATAILPTTQRVLRIPELLDMICHSLDAKTLTYAVRVNKLWSDIVIAIIWRDVSKLSPLFRLLAPTGLVLNNGNLDFRVLPTERDWRRLERYGRHVRWLKVEDPNETYSVILDRFARLRPSRPLFANLHTLDWVASSEASLLLHSVLFMHHTVHEFLLTLPTSYSHNPPVLLAQYFDHVVGRMPRIHNLVVLMQGYVAVVERELSRLVLGLRKTLVTIGFSRYFTSSTVLMEAVSHAHKLNHLYADEDVTGVFNPARKVLPVHRELEIAIPYIEAIEWLRKIPAPPPTLRDLKIVTPRLETPAVVRELCVELANKCPGLEHLNMVKCDKRPFPRRLNPSVHECVRIEHLEPVFDAMRLLEFNFQHEFPLVVRKERVVGFASKLSDVAFLGLNHSPDFDVSDAQPGDFLTLDALLVFKRLCGNLQEFGIYVDLSDWDLDCGMGELGDADSRPFEVLEELVVGGPMNGCGDYEVKEGAVALFMSRVCPKDCEVSSGMVFRHRGIPLDVSQSRAVFWERVGARKGLEVVAREEEGERAVRRIPTSQSESEIS
ncbi:hypothetical protein FA15DRAFT_659553 [Coprinopsis marcescibilis]|uniref:F-box domain-containing protein n=1 Tax=Coprinopsis marcescibilis TaxID=230819 RepID=A0A5C3KVC5_COPMA|nr:hypothetical protein FA15DRAFT_659553 [Coprinopsis marcescibilis]